jgi:hypothetical protein
MKGIPSPVSEQAAEEGDDPIKTSASSEIANALYSLIGMPASTCIHPIGSQYSDDHS